MGIVKFVTPYASGVIMAGLGVVALAVEHDRETALALISGGLGMAGGAGIVHTASRGGEG
ncbi:MAG: hypothetical protein AB1416_14345 [Actinomycetota bacterium]